MNKAQRLVHRIQLLLLEAQTEAQELQRVRSTWFDTEENGHLDDLRDVLNEAQDEAGHLERWVDMWQESDDDE